MTEPSRLHWRRKIHALLHDTPDKATDILTHEARAAQIKAIFQFEREEFFDKAADYKASAADRLPFPPAGKLTQPLAGIATLPHPLGGTSLPNALFKSAEEALEVTQKSHPFLLETDDPKAAFLCIWRFWRNWASSLDPRFTRLPADTRIPDHTIWNHLNVTTAFQGASPMQEQEASGDPRGTRPCLVLFSIGPVQDFIAAARSTRDLWSGSYLLSYLVSHALGKIADEIGPDHVVFPNLLDQPLLDLQMKDLFERHTFKGGESIWDALGLTGENLPRLLTPSLPNRFMALLPAVHPGTGRSADEFAREIADSVRSELESIANTVSSFIGSNGEETVFKFRKDAFEHQVKRMLDIQWQTLAIPGSIGELRQIADSLLPDDDEAAHYTPRKAVDAVLAMVEVPACKPAYKLSPETGWALLNALVGFLHDGVKSTRTFDAWRNGHWRSGEVFNKDALNGREEAVLVVSDDESRVASHCRSVFGMSRGTLKPRERLGASTLIKRFWHRTFLPERLGISPHLLGDGLSMPNTHAIAKGLPYDDSEESDAEAERDHREKYFAVIAMDGDEMGKWVSGCKTPRIGELLSPAAEAFYRQYTPAFLSAPRAVTPSWHLQFAEALGNFSFHAVRRIIEAFDGRLLYAGGDDVLAMVPAKDAFDCARALRAAFRGEKDHLNGMKGALVGEGKKRQSDRSTRLFNVQEEGFLQLHEDSGATHGEQKGLLSDPVDFPALVPGPRSDVSAGIAIAHFKAPLQDVVRAAQAAEKRAKRSVREGGLDRGSVALTIYKRSGEVLEWGARWAVREPDSHGTETHPTSKETAACRLLSMLTAALVSGQLNGRFPYKLEALLDPYQAESIESVVGFSEAFPEILGRELDHCLMRNEGGRLEPDQRALFIEYWSELASTPNLDFRNGLRRFLDLLRTAAWSVRGFSSATDQSHTALTSYQ